MHIVKHKKMAIVALIFALMAVLFVPTASYARVDSHPGTGGGGGSGSWNYDRDALWYKQFGKGYTSYSATGDYPGSYGHYIDVQSRDQDPNLISTLVLTCYPGTFDQTRSPYSYPTWDFLLPRSKVNLDASASCTRYLTQYDPKTGQANYAAEFIEQAHNDGFYTGQVSGRGALFSKYIGSGWQFADAIIIDRNPPTPPTPSPKWVPATTYEEKDVIVYEREGRNTEQRVRVDFETSGQNASTKWEAAPTQLQYKNSTNPNETTSDFHIEAHVQTLRKTHKYEYNQDNPAQTRNHKYYYDNIGGIKNMSKTINYQVKTKQLTQTKYAPLNVNRQGYAKAGDNGIGSDFVNGPKLDITVSNDQNISDNSSLKTLDLNADTRFKVQFNNNCLGLDASKDWKTKPPELKNGTFELTKRDASGNFTGPYANGRTLPGDEYYRYNLTLNAAISSNKQKGVDTSSFIFGGKEYKASTPYTGYVNDGTIRGGNCSARFIYIGDYTLANAVQGTDFPKWWTATYNAGMYFEYGTTYNGTITTNNISVDRIQGGHLEGSTIVTDATRGSSSERGLYVGTKASTFTQPLVTANFNVKTVAGDLTPNGQ